MRIQDLVLAPQEAKQNESQPFSPLALIACLCTFILCVLVTIAPLTRLAGTTLLSSLPTNPLLTIVGTKLPPDLHLTSNTYASQIETNTIEFLVVMVLIFLLYILSIFIIPKQLSRIDYRKFMLIIWIGAIAIGIIYVLTPSMLSHDAFVYAGYGRVIVAHHANPYYVPLSTFPHDPLLPLDDWNNALAAYGPLWLLVCALSALVSKDAALHYIFFYRLLGFSAHLLNIALITAILRTAKRSPRTVLLGTLLYAWNPLALLESCLGAHNDTLMVTSILLGILLCVWAERNDFATARYYLPPLVVFTCATLIKFTAAPLIAFYLVLLLRRSLTIPSFSSRKHDMQMWGGAARKVVIAIFVSLFLILLFYTPLWIGHSVSAIKYSLSSPPSSRLTFGSIIHALQRVSMASDRSHSNKLLTALSQHVTWDVIDGITMFCLFALGTVRLWQRPTSLMMTQATLATLGALLIVTPWFFPWYVLWLVGLAAVALPEPRDRFGLALVASALTFSASALMIYFYRGYPPIGDWIGFACLTTIGPPLLIFLLANINFGKGKPVYSRSKHE